jgi:hypothetical protein
MLLNGIALAEYRKTNVCFKQKRAPDNAPCQTKRPLYAWDWWTKQFGFSRNETANVTVLEKR